MLPTSNKTAPAPTLGSDGLRALATMARAATDVPLVAISGIDHHSATMVSEICSCGAVIGGLLPADGGGDAYAEVARRARTLHRLLGGTKEDA